MINPEDAGPTLNIRSAFVSPSFELFHYFYPFYPQLNVVYTRLPGVRVTAIHVIIRPLRVVVFDFESSSSRVVVKSPSTESSTE